MAQNEVLQNLVCQNVKQNLDTLLTYDLLENTKFFHENEVSFWSLYYYHISYSYWLYLCMLCNVCE